ncbi:hypothetical protein F3Y22_tig00110959pilonHSYRG00042 [Hibiscus syriacus]|uniref:Uncharacterized protein n=1 Tax=Hibiscus syriacus TaxID=106335 RepID=A0A6A2Z9J4_HIBSY|nr:hypothetical protein F3Y22_tig00110959pilonHSYRG00042 [Hibiscus syriacus]
MCAYPFAWPVGMPPPPTANGVMRPPNGDTGVDGMISTYGTDGGGAYAGQVSTDAAGSSYNLNEVKGRRFMVQWVWNPVKKRCFGPNAMD